MNHAHLQALEQEHRQLEGIIRHEYAAHNDDTVRRLKIEKLYLKEEIMRLRGETEA